MMPRIIFAFLFVSAASLAHAQKSECKGQEIKTEVKKMEGSVSLMALLWGSEDSLRKRIEFMLPDALETAIKTESPCPAACSTGLPQIEFKALSRLFKDDYDEKIKCNKLLEITKKLPITYSLKPVKDMTELVDEFVDISRGRGEKGEDLYTRCDGECSPRYKVTVTITQDNWLQNNVAILCGPARDTDDNTYNLSTELVWKCQN